MSGKSKAQRTKNNSRPSNSGRSAELLGKGAPAFVGFSALGSSGIVPVVPGFQTSKLEEVDMLNVDPAFQIILKKMSKKSETTKIKALNEFSELVSTSPIDVVKDLLAFWPKLYLTLAFDIDNGVRLSTQSATHVLLQKVQKAVIPYLKQLAPVWVTSQNDPNSQSANMAKKIFDLFPEPFPKKLVSVCQNEILDFITQNLLQPISEDYEEKHTLCTVCNLKGYAYYLRNIDETDMNVVVDKNMALLDNAKFWNYHKSKFPAVRAAFFEALQSILQHASGLVQKYDKMITMSVFKNLDETETIVIPLLWPNTLLVPKYFEKWNTHISFEKLLYPKLWKVITSNGFNNSTTIYPFLVPLANNIVKTLSDDKSMHFYGNFMDNLKLSLKSERIMISKKDLEIINLTYFECLKLILNELNKATTPGGLETLMQFINMYLIDVLNWLIQVTHNNKKMVYPNLSKLIFYMNNNQINKFNGNIIGYVWECIYATITKQIGAIGGNAGETIIENQIKFLNELNLKVNRDDASDANIYNGHLTALIIKLSTIYYDLIVTSKNFKYYESFNMLLNTYANREFYVRLNDGNENLITLCDKLLSLLDVKSLQNELLVDRIFNVINFLGDTTDKVAVINRLLNYNDDDITYWTISHILSHPICNEAYAATLMTADTVKNYLLKITHNVVANTKSSHNLQLLNKCFYYFDNANAVAVDYKLVEDIIEILLKLLDSETNENNEVIDLCARFISQNSIIFYSNDKYLRLQVRIFLIFFKFSINQRVSDHLSEDTIYEINTSWQDILSDNDIALAAILPTCTALINNKLDSMKDGAFDLAEITSLADKSRQFIRIVIERNSNDVDIRQSTILNEFFKSYTKIYRDNIEVLKNLIVFIELLNSDRNMVDLCHIQLNSESNNDFSIILSDLLSKTIFLLNTMFYYNEFGGIQRHGDEEEFVEIENTWGEDILSYVHEIYSVDYLLGRLKHYEGLESFGGLKMQTVKPGIEHLSKTICQINTLTGSDNLVNLKAKLNESLKLKTYPAANILIDLLEDNKIDGTNTELFTHYVETPYQDGKLVSKVVLDHFIKFGTNFDRIVKSFNMFGDTQDNLLSNLFLNQQLIRNYFDTKFDVILGNSMNIYNVIVRLNKNVLAYNVNVKDESLETILLLSEIINFVINSLTYYPSKLVLKHFDFIRISLSSWILSVSQSVGHFKDSKVNIFMGSVFKLFKAFMKFMADVRSNKLPEMEEVIDEWDKVFSKDVNLVLMKIYYTIVTEQLKRSEDSFNRSYYLMDIISDGLNYVDLSHVIRTGKVNPTLTLKEFFDFCIENLSHKIYSVRISSASLIKGLSLHLISNDLEELNKQYEQSEKHNKDNDSSYDWNLLNSFAKQLKASHELIVHYIENFTLRINDLDGLKPVDESIAISYFLLWDCVLNIVAESTSEMRSIYARWIKSNKFEVIFLMFLFRTMPTDLLKNPDTKMVFGQTMFAPLEWDHIKRGGISKERLSCFMYTQMLRYLPALARKWWHDLTPQQASIVEKVTSNFISKPLCQHELRCVLEKRTKEDNMQIKVTSSSTSEVVATYSIDETKMELMIKLPVNHPLGQVTIQCNRQVGGLLQSRDVVKQLTIFLTYQNGSIWDVLSIWKRNLDRKFEGVEECYVCYSVIHQDTCQLPKLSCKTCKKKYHGPCLYKWFNTSNKSTCPICRNIF